MMAVLLSQVFGVGIYASPMRLSLDLTVRILEDISLIGKESAAQLASAMYASLLPHTRLIFRVEGAPLNVLSMVGGVGGSMVMFVNPVQPSNKEAPKETTLFGIISVRNALHPLKQS